MKPWARYEVGFINHDKFRAITANAICLWLEGKNYADAKLTDGLLPEYEVKLWRFHSKKSVAILTRSCGLKPGTDTLYQPLWDVVEGFGFKMHDYLEHNPSREDALARIDDADAAKVAANEVTRDRMTRWRALKKAKRDAPVTPSVTPRVTSPERNTERNERNGYALLQNTEDRRQKKEQEQEKSAELLSAPVFLTYPVVGLNGSEWHLTEHQIATWEQLFPGVDVPGECRKALAWVQANPTKRKTFGGMLKFLAGWLTRATDRGGGSPGLSVVPPLGKLSTRMAAMVVKAREEGV